MKRDEAIHDARLQATDELLGTFFQLSDEWSLTTSEQTKILGHNELHNLNRRIEFHEALVVGDQTLMRLSILKSIQEHIKKLSPATPAKVYLRTENENLDSRKPLSVILSDPEEGLEKVSKELMKERMLHNLT